MELDFDMLKELDMLLTAFHENNVRYAVCGGFAVALYGYVRATKDIDLLCHPEDVKVAGQSLKAIGYRQHAEPWTFRSSSIALHRWMKSSADELFYVIDLLVPPDEKMNWVNAACEVPWGKKGVVRVVTKEHLCEMKELRGSDMDKMDLSKLKGKS